MSDTPLVSVLIVNKDGRKWLGPCLDSLFAQTYKQFEVIIADNGSGDDSLSFVRSKYPSVRIIENKDNLGFACANNIAAEYAQGQELFILNTDTVLCRDTIQKLLEYKDNNAINITGPVILNGLGDDIYQGRKLSIDCTGYVGWGKNTFYIEGSAMMVSKKDYSILEGFDRDYFMYSEDIDLCWRAHLLGLKVQICSDTVITHFGGGSSTASQFKKGDTTYVIPLLRRYEVEKNNLAMLIKNVKLLNLCWIIPLYLFQALGECVFYCLSANFKAAIALVRAFGWNIRNLDRTLAKRRHVQRTRAVSDAYIFSKMSAWPNKLKALMYVGLPKFR